MARASMDRRFRSSRQADGGIAPQCRGERRSVSGLRFTRRDECGALNAGTHTSGGAFPLAPRAPGRSHRYGVRSARCRNVHACCNPRGERLASCDAGPSVAGSSWRAVPAATPVSRAALGIRRARRTIMRYSPASAASPRPRPPAPPARVPAYAGGSPDQAVLRTAHPRR